MPPKVPLGNWNEGGIFALNASSGERLWAVSATYSSLPSVANGVVYAGIDSSLVALSASTGQRLGSFSVPGSIEGGVTQPVVANGFVYVYTGGVPFNMDNFVAFHLP